VLKDKEGNRLFRKVIVKIVFPDAIFPPRNIIQHAGPKQGFGPGGIDDILDRIADQLDTLYPWWEFKVMPLAPEGRTAKYVLTFAGYRSTKIKTSTEATTLEPGTAEENTPVVAVPEAIGNIEALPSQE
jgi:hypothetical protein